MLCGHKTTSISSPAAAATAAVAILSENEKRDPPADVRNPDADDVSVQI